MEKSLWHTVKKRITETNENRIIQNAGAIIIGKIAQAVGKKQAQTAGEEGRTDE